MAQEVLVLLLARLDYVMRTVDTTVLLNHIKGLIFISSLPISAFMVFIKVNDGWQFFALKCGHAILTIFDESIQVTSLSYVNNLRHPTKAILYLD